jgi:hypothetical protein
MITNVQPVYRYRVDETDVIDFVDRWWLAFARENNAVELNEPAVVGRKLWDFISDEPTQELYREIHVRVRTLGNPIAIPFRCDSPTLQRFMQLTISRQDEGHLMYESKLIQTKVQHRLAVLDPKKERAESVLTMCSFCKRSLIEPSGWLELENISLKLRMYEQQKVPALLYTVCPDCSNQFQNN